MIQNVKMCLIANCFQSLTLELSGHLLHAAGPRRSQVFERHQRRVPSSRQPRGRLLQPGKLQGGPNVAPVPTRLGHEVQRDSGCGFCTHKVTNHQDLSRRPIFCPVSLYDAILTGLVMSKMC
jgi:hypothetical protein